jgi:hypothetical protein
MEGKMDTARQKQAVERKREVGREEKGGNSQAGYIAPQ